MGLNFLGARIRLGLVLIMAASLAACGGGDGGSGGSSAATTPSTTSPAPTPATPQSSMQPACTGCAATDANTYAGSGIGIWSATNTGTTAITANVAITMAGGLTGQDVRVVYTNAGDVAVPFSTYVKPASAQVLAAESASATSTAQNLAYAAIQEFNRAGFAKLFAQNAVTSQLRVAAATPQVVTTYAVNSQRQWNDYAGAARTATLLKQQQTGDGTMVNVWVENTEFAPSRVTQAMVDQVLSTYARAGGVYDILTAVGGPLWGPTSSANVLGPNQPIDLVLLNLTPDSQPYGMVGYFNSLNNFLPSSQPSSNGSLSLYLDTETMYLAGSAGMRAVLMKTVHEGMHMQNFYRRAMLKGASYAFDTWLEEQTATMMEDWASLSVDSTFNSVRDTSVPGFIAEGAYTCGLTNFTNGANGTCDSTAANGSFGGFLNRQLGLAFYKDLLTRTDSTDSKTVLDNAIKAARSDSGFIAESTRFSVTMASLMPAMQTVARYSFPARAEGGFQLPAVDMQKYQANQPAAALVANLPAHSAYFSRRGPVVGTYTDTIPVPPGTTAWVVIQPKL